MWNSQAQFCNWGFMLVRTDPGVPKHRGITFLLVDMATPGIEARPLVQMNGAAHFNEVFFTDVRVPVANAVGEIDGGWGPARTVLTNESAFIGERRGSGPLASLVELARRHARLDDPLIRQQLVDVWARERIQRWMGEAIQAAVRGGGAPHIDPGIMSCSRQSRSAAAANWPRPWGAWPWSPTGTSQLDGPRHELMGRYAVSIGGGTSEVIRNNVAERALDLPREPSIDRNAPWRDIPR